MAKLNRFIINTDYDSLKTVKHQEWELTLPSITINNGQNGPQYNYDFTVDPGVYFEMFSAESSAYPGYCCTGDSNLYISEVYNPGRTILGYDIYTGKTSSTNFRIKVIITASWGPSSPASITTIARTIKIKANLLVPSEQQ